MDFLNPYFYLILFTVILIQGTLKGRIRSIFLVVCSLWMYASIDPVLAGVLIVSSMVNFQFARWQKIPTWVVFVFNLALLFAFKLSGEIDGYLIPIGISFFTFQAIGFVLEERKEPANFSFLDFLLFLCFFPQLIAGPIERSKDLIPQLKQDGRFDEKYLEIGIQRVLWGIVKKVVLANPLGILAGSILDAGQSLSWDLLFLGGLAFMLQLLFDFSAYCDIAIGLGKTMNISLTENFNSPYKATSFGEFWKRWHFSLHRWLKEFVFQPLKKKLGWFTAMLIVFLFSGLWHGITFNYLIWALMALLWMLLLDPVLKRLPPILARVKLFILMLIIWLPFRMDTDALFLHFSSLKINGLSTLELFHDLGYQFFHLNTAPFGVVTCPTLDLGLGYLQLFILLFGSLLAFWIDGNRSLVFSPKFGPLKVLLWLAILVVFGSPNYSPFIYLQF